MTVSDLIRSRELLVNLTLREIRGKYKRTVLGQGWSLLNPLVSLAIFSLVFGLLLRADPPAGSPSGLDTFALWLAAGLLPWAFFASSVQAGMQSVLANANLVQKVYFPREVLVTAAVLSFVVTFCVELIALVVVLLLAGGAPLLYLPLVVVAIAGLAAFALGLGLGLSVANVYFRDTSYLMALVFQLWFYLTPIVYPSRLVDAVAADRGGLVLLGVQVPLERLYHLNPMTRFVDVFRALLYDNRIPDWEDSVGAALSAVVALTVGALVFRRFSGRLAEEL